MIDEPERHKMNENIFFARDGFSEKSVIRNELDTCFLGNHPWSKANDVTRSELILFQLPVLLSQVIMGH